MQNLQTFVYIASSYDAFQLYCTALKSITTCTYSKLRCRSMWFQTGLLELKWSSPIIDVNEIAWYYSQIARAYKHRFSQYR